MTHNLQDYDRLNPGRSLLDEVLEFDELGDERDAEITLSPRQYIRWVQLSLRRILGVKLEANGKDSAAYREAVKAFQRQPQWRLSVDGKVGQHTQNALIKANAQNPHYVEWINKALNQTGADLPDSDTMMSEQTKTAIKGFQAYHGLRDDGWVGPKTEFRLIQASKILPPDRPSGYPPSKLPKPKSRKYPSDVPKPMITWLEAPVRGVAVRRFPSTDSRYRFLVAWKSETPRNGCGGPGPLGRADRGWFAGERDDLEFWKRHTKSDRVASIVADAKRTYNEKIAWYMQEKKLCPMRARAALRKDDKDWLLQLAILGYGTAAAPHRLGVVERFVADTARLIRWLNQR